MKRIGKFEQGSPEWHRARSGMVCGSQIHRIMTARPSTLETLREEIRRYRKHATSDDPRQRERLPFTTRAMRWGNTHEAQARAVAEIELGRDFEETGLVIHDDHFYVGASPDGFCVATNEGLELKCPWTPANHDKMATKIPKPYRWQCHAGLWVTGADRWWFGSFDPRRLGTGQEIFLHRIERNDRMIAQMDERIPEFWESI